MIAITGAGGKTGRALVQALARRGVAARAVVRSLTGSDELRTLGAAEVAQADFADVARL
ncbi:MAG: NAD(P)H-binding protein, partial [Caldilineaceae bacterium]|nr:NAD(P)H-binding protein [Caldilineaceae bacterium]